MKKQLLSVSVLLISLFCCGCSQHVATWQEQYGFAITIEDSKTTHRYEYAPPRLGYEIVYRAHESGYRHEEGNYTRKESSVRLMNTKNDVSESNTFYGICTRALCNLMLTQKLDKSLSREIISCVSSKCDASL